jgi:DNA-binding transcriptional regulator YiaG
MRLQGGGNFLPFAPMQTANPFAALRADLGVSQRKFAAMFGVTPRTMRLWERDANLAPVAARKLLEGARMFFRA